MHALISSPSLVLHCGWHYKCTAYVVMGLSAGHSGVSISHTIRNKDVFSQISLVLSNSIDAAIIAKLILLSKTTVTIVKVHWALPQ